MFLFSAKLFVINLNPFSLKQSLLVLSFVLLMAIGLSAQRPESKIQNDSRLVSTEFLNLNWEDRLNHILHSDSVYDSERYQQEGRVPFLAFSHFEFEQSLAEELFYLEGPELEYINRIHQRLLQSNEALAKATQVVVINDFQVNAFCHPNGVIAITTGLLARLETEGELAFVIAHEAAHYALDHSFIRHSSSEMEEEGNYFSSSKTLNAHRQYLKRSKEHELAADSEAVKTMQAAGYGITEAEALLIKLFRSDLPMEMKPLSHSPLIDGIDFQLPEKLVLKDTSGFRTNYNYRDEGHTHPNIGERITAVQAYTTDGAEELKALVSEMDFQNLKDWSRKRLILEARIGMDVAKLSYEFASYKDLYDGESLEVDYQYYSSLYRLIALMDINKISQIIPEIQYVDGPVQAYYYSLKNINLDELALLCLSNLNHYYHKGGNLERFEEIEWAILAIILKEEKPMSSAASLIMKNPFPRALQTSFKEGLVRWLSGFKGGEFEDLAHTMASIYKIKQLEAERISSYVELRQRIVENDRESKDALIKRRVIEVNAFSLFDYSSSASHGDTEQFETGENIDFLMPKVNFEWDPVEPENMGVFYGHKGLLVKNLRYYGPPGIQFYVPLQMDSVNPVEAHQYQMRMSRLSEVRIFNHLKIAPLTDPRFKDSPLIGIVEIYDDYDMKAVMPLVDPYSGEMIELTSKTSALLPGGSSLEYLVESLMENIKWEE